MLKILFKKGDSTIYYFRLSKTRLKANQIINLK